MDQPIRVEAPISLPFNYKSYWFLILTHPPIICYLFDFQPHTSIIYVRIAIQADQTIYLCHVTCHTNMNTYFVFLMHFQVPFPQIYHVVLQYMSKVDHVTLPHRNLLCLFKFHFLFSLLPPKFTYSSLNFCRLGTKFSAYFSILLVQR